jgi:hypothetical protein
MNVRFIILVSLFVLLLGAAFIYWTPAPAQEPQIQSPPQRESPREYSSDAYGISFYYPQSYVLTEHDAPGSGMRTNHTITLTRIADLPLPKDGEGPPTITIDIYQNNLDTMTTESWIRNTSASNFKLGDGRLATTTISGLPALSYRWSGLYEGTTIALAQPQWVYVFTVTYLEMGAAIIQDFVAIRDSVLIGERR